jgi:hypothetical protein
VGSSRKRVRRAGGQVVVVEDAGVPATSEPLRRVRDDAPAVGAQEE